jgi:hypothetical protein
MQGKTKERWMEVAKAITQEQDPQKFLARLRDHF